MGSARHDDDTIGVEPTPVAAPRPYYEQYDRACDWVVRCDDCKALVTVETLHEGGACQTCGNHKFKEVRTLSPDEVQKILAGEIRFPHSEEFLAEFAQPTGTTS